ncbi:MAG TPA: prolyl oligopeptidase family serine peptidase [Thermoanaerobaculia bacterium]|jgi:prolyl oligopeptidase
MKRTLIALGLTILVACATTTQVSKTPVPATQAKPVTETLHGVTLTDPYRWLEDQQAPETRDWITRQNAYTDALIGNLPQKQAAAARIEEMLNIDQMSTPFVRGGRYFFSKRPKGADQYAIYMRESATGPDVLLIDPLPMDPKHTTSVGIQDATDDGKLLAYYVRHGGADETETRFFDVDARRDTGTPLAVARYSGTSVTPDGRTVYYSRKDKEGDRVYRRAVAGGAEEKLFGEGYGPEKIIGTSLSDDGRYLLMHVYYGAAPKKIEVYVKDIAGDGPIKTVVNDLDAKASVDVAGDTLVIQTDWNAPNERVMIAPVASPGRENWKELVPENKSAALQGTSLVGGKIYVRYLENVRPRVIAYDLSGKKHEEIRFDVLGSLSDVAGRWSSPLAFYRFTSFALPSTIYTYDTATEKSSVFFRPNVPVKTDDFTVEQVWYASKDGTRIPMFLFYKKGLQRNGANPVWLTGYGGFLLSQSPGFSSSAVTWAEHGGIYALPNLRGGGEFGEAWHHAGMLAHKQNTFDDFIAAAQYLIDEKYTSSRHLGISGGSNGGLLVTAFLTQRPELAHAVVCSYPLVDMLRYDKFLVGSYWVPEYGSADDPEQFKWLYAYSPYQHVTKGTKYPSVLFITGDADTRVAPLHARKMAALLQNSTGSDNPVMIRYHVSGGHSGGDPLKVQVNNAAETIAFLEWQLR